MDMIAYDSILGDSDPPSTTTFSISNSPAGLPDGSYAFVEYFCPSPNCDCRLANIFIYEAIVNENGNGMLKPLGKALAVIQYGWETEEYYTERFKDLDLDCDFSGATLNHLQNQSKFASDILDIFREAIEEDEEFRLQIEEHYYDLKFKMKERAKNPIPARPSFQPASFLPSLRKKRMKMR